MTRLIAVAAVAASLLLPGLVRAQDRLIAGPVFLYHDAAEVRGLGGYFAVPVVGVGERDLRISPSFIWYFAEDDLMEVNADVLYSTSLVEGVPLRPFVLGGLGLSLDWGENAATVAVNAGAGLRLRVTPLEAGLGAKLQLRSGVPVVYFARVGFVVF